MRTGIIGRRARALALAAAALLAASLAPRALLAAAASDSAHRASRADTRTPRRTTVAKKSAKPAKAKKRVPAPKRAKVGQRVPVEITYYCLQGTTRTDRPTRPGIVAADPRVFPLRRHVELFSRGGASLGQFLVDDTGGLVRGHIVDVWVPSCDDARRRGRRHGTAVLLKRGAIVDGLAARPPAN